MEEESKRRGHPLPQLLNLIPDEREWKLREAGGGGRSRNTSFSAEEVKKLELKLGLPGVLEEERAANSTDKKTQQQESSSVLSLGYSPTHSKFSTDTATTGAKRGFLDTVEAKSVGYNQKQQHKVACGKELTLADENIAGERKKGCCPPAPSHVPAAAPVLRSRNPPGRVAVPPVVGWPPIRSFRRNLANSSSSKQSPEPLSGEADAKAKHTCKKSSLIKINMDGIPIGRKVDLAAYDNYEKLSSAVEELFRGFLQAQRDLSCAESGQQGAEEKIFSRLLDGAGEYTLVYEDNEGDRMLVGDVPWNVFVTTAKRLRVLRSSELSHGLIGTGSRRAVDC